jgi:hemoglobin
MSVSPFERIGGEPPITAAVGIFYEKVIGDDHLAPFFNGINLEKQVRKQRELLPFALGGTQKWTGRTPPAAPKKAVGQGLSDQHFDRVVGHLVDTLDELGGVKGMIHEVVAIVGPSRDDVLSC